MLKCSRVKSEDVFKILTDGSVSIIFESGILNLAIIDLGVRQFFAVENCPRHDRFSRILGYDLPDIGLTSDSPARL